jgi:hypothetical protein
MQRQASRLLRKFGGGLKTAASIQNEQITIGQKMIPMLNNLNKAQVSITKGFEKLAGDPLINLTDGIVKLTDAIAGKSKKSLLGVLAEWVTVT